MFIHLFIYVTCGNQQVIEFVHETSYFMFTDVNIKEMYSQFFEIYIIVSNLYVLLPLLPFVIMLVLNKIISRIPTSNSSP